MQVFDYHIYASGNNSITIKFGEAINELTSKRVLSFYNHLLQKNLTGIKSIIPAYSTVTIVYDTLLIKKNTEGTAFLYVEQLLKTAIATCDFEKTSPGRLIEIPVCYDALFGLDIQTVAKEKNISTQDIIEMHSNQIYRVYMIGFLPGFAYMGILNENLFTERKAQPRAVVAAGSVAIAGKQTGIYPSDSPGGWNIIGKTNFTLFNAKNKKPSLLMAGDEVKFIPVSLKEFQKM